jgi:hypothetical protein
MIIGISGVANSGKDTIADRLVDFHRFIKLSFADPLKRICMDAFDFSEQQLWGPSDERNKEDKRYFSYRRKETIVNYEDARCFAHLDAAAHNKVLTKEEEDKYIEEYMNVYLSPRAALQSLGTWGRDCYQNVWVEYAMRKAKEILSADGTCMTTRLPLVYAYDKKTGVNKDRKIPGRGVVIPDVRFKNEIEAVQNAGGKVVRVLRPDGGLKGEYALHKSETELLSIPDSEFDYVIKNDATLKDLYKRVDCMKETILQ